MMRTSLLSTLLLATLALATDVGAGQMGRGTTAPSKAAGTSERTSTYTTLALAGNAGSRQMGQITEARSGNSKTSESTTIYTDDERDRMGAALERAALGFAGVTQPANENTMGDTKADTANEGPSHGKRVKDEAAKCGLSAATGAVDSILGWGGLGGWIGRTARNCQQSISGLTEVLFGR